MTFTQLAVATGGDLKWLRNSAAILGVPLRASPSSSRVWSLVRLLNTTFYFPLDVAARMAAVILPDANSRECLGVIEDEYGCGAFMLDFDRFGSIFLANLSRALNLDTPKKRGRHRPKARDAVAAARAYGLDIPLIESALRRSPDERLRRLDADAQFLRALRSRAR